MGSDIFTAVKGLTFPSDTVTAQFPSSSEVEQVRRARLARERQINANTRNAQAFFKGKRLLGGNLLRGGGKPIDADVTRVTRGLFAEVQKDEDDAFALLLSQARERITKNQFRASAFNRVSAEERVRRLLENAPHSREPERYRFSTYDPEGDKRRLREQQANNAAILQTARDTLARPLRDDDLPNVSERPRLTDLLPDNLRDSRLNGNIALLLVRRLVTLDLDSGTPAQDLALDKLLRLYPAQSFLGLTTPAQITEKQQELGLTDKQVEEQQTKDADSLPTHVVVTLQGRSLNFDSAFLERQRQLDPNFEIQQYKTPAGSLVLDGRVLFNHTTGGSLIHHTLTYAEYQRLQYRPPATGSAERIDYFSAIPVRDPDGSQGTPDKNSMRGIARSVALTTPATPPPATPETVNGVQYDRYDISLPTETEGAFNEVDLIFEGTTFAFTATNILEALQNGDLVIKATQQGYNKNYGNDRALTLDNVELRKDLSDSIVGNENRVRFKFFAEQSARSGIDLQVYIRRQGIPSIPALDLQDLRAQFL